MARGSVQQRMMTVAGFLIGMRHRDIVAALACHGLDAAEVARGWGLISAIGGGDFEPRAPNTSDLIAELDAWENVWFAVANAVLGNRFPEAHQRVFENLRPQARAKVVLSVQTFLERIDALEASGPDGAAAMTALASRGLDGAMLDVARQLLARTRTAEAADRGEAERAADEAAAEAMWRWYKEWSGIARAVLTDRNQLRALGLAQDRKTTEPEDDAET